MIKFNFLFALTGLALLFTFSSCDKDDDTTRTDSDVALEFNYTVGEEDFNYDQTYTINDVAVSFSAIQFYAGGLEFHPEEGDAVSIPDYLLVKPGMTTDQLVSLDKGHYHMLKFFVGVAPEDNDQTEEDFTARASDDPLAKQAADQPRMHWNWNAGYIFFRIDGMVDLDADGTPESPLEFHIGTDSMLRNLSVTMHSDIEDDATTLGLTMDVEKLFAGIDLLTENQCHTGDAPALATTFADNLVNAFAKK